jgi:transposase
MRVTPQYDEQFRIDAVELYKKSNRSCRQVAMDLGISDVSLMNWYKRFEMAKRKKRSARVVAAEKALDRLVTSEPADQRLARLERENAALRKENDDLKMDREILKKAAAFFAKESE